MKTKRIILSLIVVGNAMFPVIGIACLSGAEQTTIANNFLNTGLTIARANIDAVIPKSDLGIPALDALLNGINKLTLDLLQYGIQVVASRQINSAIPDDPFPGP
jgi:hypothetical protein